SMGTPMRESNILPLTEIVLGGVQEEMPQWLIRYEPGDPFDRETFFSSRVIFYPGSGTDGQPVKLLGETHAAHCFVYADYGIGSEAIRNELRPQNPHRFK